MSKNKKTLYFKHGNGAISIVATDVDADSAYAHIKKYCHKLNPKFKIYYCRMHDSECDMNDGRKIPVTHYDVGSHSEFFYLTELELGEFTSYIKN